MSTLRTFLAIELPDEVRSRIGKLQQSLMKCGVSVKWVETQNLHLTMWFFGDIEEERIEDIRSATEEAALAVEPTEVKLEGLGAFPSAKRPRVIWVGVSDGRAQVLEIRKALEEKLELAGFARAKGKFSAHVTLGRVKDQTARVALLSRELSEQEFPASEVFVREISGIKSDLTRTGPIYTKLFSVELGSRNRN